MKSKIIAVLFVIVFLLLVAVVFSLLNDNSSPDDISSFRPERRYGQVWPFAALLAVDV